MTKFAQREELKAAMEQFLKNGGKIQILPTPKKSKDTALNKFGVSAWSKFATVGHMGRQYNLTRTDAAGSFTNRAA